LINSRQNWNWKTAENLKWAGVFRNARLGKQLAEGGGLGGRDCRVFF